MQESGDKLLRPGAEKSRQADCRRAGGAGQEAHRHHRGAVLEEHRQRQRHPPPMRRRLLSRFLRLKKRNRAQLLPDAVICI